MNNQRDDGYCASAHQGIVGRCCIAIVGCFMLLAGCTSGATSDVRNCGTVNANRTRATSQPTAHDAESCLAQAFAKCQAAILVFARYGVDAGATYTLTVQSGKSGCLVAVKEDDLSNTVHHVVNYACSQVQQQATTLTIRQCAGHDDITIASP